MIVYVPIIEHGFAFLNTVNMRFIEIGGDQVFIDVRDLREAGGDRRLIEMAECAAESAPHPPDRDPALPIPERP